MCVQNFYDKLLENDLKKKKGESKEKFISEVSLKDSII